MSATRHSFDTRDPIKRFTEQLRFYGKLRGTDYHVAFPLPKTLVSDLRQLIKPWNSIAMDALPAFMGGLATAWKDIFNAWIEAAERIENSKLAPNDVYDDNAGFWVALRRLALQLDAKDMIMTRSDVLVWAVKDTLREHAETVKDAAEAVYDAGKEAADAVTGGIEAIPTIAKALAVGAVGLGVYAIAKK